ncbi:MAG TPA: choice-of-anchor tandem repeat GloVer-containing protein [Candidatus Methylacidiphilales bacterium]|jgi:uncharacterized repeat protein (TIGR03803 family)|nr:choice-of-anchor tandem repeat GloVer-containing protein [Candidatus Methylacidiphilales bacterium]
MKIKWALLGLIALAIAEPAQAQTTDVGSYNVQKVASYDQTSLEMPTPDPQAPYQFNVQINPGSTGALLPTSTLAPPNGSTITASFQASSNGLQFAEDFETQATLDAATPAGTYNLTIQTTTPNTYNVPVTVNAADNFPVIPQIASVTNATWNSTGQLVVTDITQPVTITWTTFESDSGNIFFEIDNTSIGQSFTPNGTNNSITIPANTFANNTAYKGSINFSNANFSNTVLPGVNGGSSFATQDNFVIEAGTPAAAASTLYIAYKSHIVVQTSNSAPANGSGANDASDPAPYNMRVQSPIAGSATGPGGDLPVTFEADDNNEYNDTYYYSSGAITDQATLDSIDPDGTYTLTDGNVAALTGDVYPNTPQITLVNGATPTWNSQGQLVLNPAIANTITWSAINVVATTFAASGHEEVHFQSDGDGLVNIKQTAGIAASSTTAFNTLTIPANSMTAERTYVGTIGYFLSSSLSSPSANVYDAAGYQTENTFTAIATPSGGLVQTINFPALNPEQVAGTNVTLVATATSGLPVSFSVLSGPASLSGNVLTFNATGTVVVQASQAGNATYAAASPVSQTFTVNSTSSGGVAQTITFPAIASPQNSGLPITLSATATSGLPVTFSVASGPATVAGTTLTFTGTGSVTINADQAGNGTYAAATTVGQTFSVNAPTDVGNLNIQKSINYDQSAAATETLDPNQPYQFSSYVNEGSTGTLLSTSTLTPPSTGTNAAIPFQAGLNGLSFQENFQTQAAMDAAFLAGTYNFSLQTTTPNTYAASLVLGADNFSPANPQITSVTNAAWIGGRLVVTNPTQPVTFTWPGFNSAIGNIQFQINANNSSSSIVSQSFAATGANTGYTLPANSLTNNTYYQGSLIFGNYTNAGGIPGINASAGYQVQVSFTIQVGTPTPPTSTVYAVSKANQLVQTSSAAPVNGTGDGGNDTDPAPYDLRAQSPVAGSVTGPTSTNYTLEFDAGDGNGSGQYKYSSGPVGSLAALNSTYPDGNYTLADGNVVALTGDAYPNAPQVTLVNGATPIWNTQGQLVLDPTVTNTITWTAINETAGTFATNGHEDAEFESPNDGSVDIEQKAGITETSTTTFNTLTIPANTMTLNDTYAGSLNYTFLPSIGSPSANVYDAAGYETETSFTAVAQLLAASFSPTFNSATSIGVVSNGYIATGALTLNLGFAPTVGTVLTVVDNTGSGPIIGTFSNVAEGGAISATFGGTTYTFTATYKGGDGNDMTLTYTPPLGPSSLTILHTFNDGSVTNDGRLPGCRLTQGSDGNFYATTETGGSAGDGTIYKITPQGQVAILHSFNDGSVANDGQFPFNGLIQASDGNFYGMATSGGSANAGCVYTMTPQGVVTILHSFGDGSVTNDGQTPNANLIQASDGNFYGTTSAGGSAGNGAAFKITAQGQLTILHSFGDGSVTGDGRVPESELVQAADGNFYGTTNTGGSAGNGTVYKITPQGQVTILHSFGDGSVPNDGASPAQGLLQGPDGNFYGMTSSGGIGGASAGFGTVYKMTPQGVVTILHRFNDGSVPDDGNDPAGDLILGLDGNYYGMTEFGGSNPTPQDFGTGVGTIFKITPQGVTTILHSFADGSVLNDGQEPLGGLVQASDGTLYGTTFSGGDTGGDGTVFKFAPGLPVITSPLTANGSVGLPFSYQTTALNTPTSYSATNLPAGLGIDPATGLISGTPTAPGTSVVVLTMSNAKGPASAPLTITIAALPAPAVTSILSAYGTAGTAFTYSISATNNPTGYTATGPSSGPLPSWLTLTSNTLSGTPPSAGTFPITLTAGNGSGASHPVTLVIQIFGTPPTASDEYNILYSFNNGATNDAAGPNILFQGFDGTFYGLSSGGGTAFSGTIFNTTTQGITSVFHSFGTGVNDVFSPQGLLQASDGNYYGTTSGGGTAGMGAVFKITQAGVETILHSFGDGSVVNDGASPQSAGLVQGADGNFYGMTTSGGSKNLGVIYKITPLGVVTILHNFGDGSVANDGASPQSTLIQGQNGDTNFYGTTQYGGSNGAGTVFEMTLQGAVTILHSFQSGTVLNESGASVADGANPVAPLLEAVNGYFYGTTQNGGSHGTGSVFQMTPSGTVTILHSFGDGTVTNDGAGPVAPLVLGYDGNFYGTTYRGGSANQGTVFAMSPTGAETLIHPFGTLTNDGAFPNAALCQGTDGNFYGTTSLGGAGGSGTVFSIVTTQGTTHAPVFTGATTVSAAALSPFSFTPKASFGVSNNGTGGDIVRPSFVPQMITKLFNEADDWILSGTLPEYLTFDSVSGTITGTPIESGIYTVTMTPVNASGQGTPQTITIYVEVAPVITSPTTATGSVGASFSYTTTAAASPTSFGATGLPAWLSVNTTTGVISGTPPGTGSYIFSPTATNVYGTGTQQVILTVGTSAITSPATASTTVGSSFTYQITAGNSPASYSALSLPPGLLFNSTTGEITGTPTTTGTYLVPISATNASGSSSSSSVLTITVNPASAPIITSCSALTCSPSTVLSYQITGTNSPTSFTASGLPAGLSLNSSTGAITGIPSAVGSSTATLSATNSIGTGTATLAFTVAQTAAVPELTSSATAGGTAILPFSYQITASNSPTTYAAVGLPPGLTINSTTGEITGSPTTSGAWNVTLYLTNNSLGTGASDLTLTFTKPTFAQWASLYSNVDPNAPAATPENDGVANLLKYLFDINPSSPISSADRDALPALGVTTIQGVNYATLTYRQYALETGVTINVQTSPDMQNWTTLASPTIIQTGTDPTTGDPVMQVQVPLSGAPSKEFLRLNVTQP